MLVRPVKRGVTYRLIPTRVSIWNEIAKLIKCLDIGLCIGTWRRNDRAALCGWFHNFLFGWTGRRGGRSDGFCFGVEGTDLKLFLKLLENTLVVIFPELF